MSRRKPLLAVLPILAFAILALASCGKPISPAQQKSADDRAVAQIEATNRAPPPLRPVVPQALGKAFLTRHAAAGKACAFEPRGEATAIALALDDRVELLIDGLPAVFSADKGSTRLPSGAWSRYLGKALVLALEQPGAGSPIARLVIRDPYNRPVFEAAGTLRCPAV